MHAAMAPCTRKPRNIPGELCSVCNYANFNKLPLIAMLFSVTWLRLKAMAVSPP